MSCYFGVGGCVYPMAKKLRMTNKGKNGMKYTKWRKNCEEISMTASGSGTGDVHLGTSDLDFD